MCHATRLDGPFRPSYCIFHEVSHVSNYLQRANIWLFSPGLVHFVSQKSIGCATVLPLCVRLVLTQEPAPWHVVGDVDLASIYIKD